MFFEGTRLICANAGDSRAIKCSLFRTDPDGEPTIEATAVSRDHKLEDPAEAARVLDCGGRIDSFRDTQNMNEPIGPQRVWLPD